MKRSKEGACSTSYPSGNQVDGLPLVAMINMFLNVIASICVLVSLEFVMYYISRIQIEVSKLQIRRLMYQISAVAGPCYFT